VLAAFVVAAGLNAFAVIAFGGDYVHARLLLPALFALCAPVAVMPVAARYVASLAIIAWAFVCATALRPPETRASNGVASTDGIAYLLPPNVAGHVTLSQVGWGEHSPRRRRVQIGSLFVLNTVYGSHITRATTPLAPGVHNPTFVAGGIGAIGYALGPRFSIIDLHGLGDPLAAHLQLARRGWPGHEKTLPAAWVAALVTATNSNPRLRDFPIRRSLSTPPGNESFDEQVRWARSALQCSAISDLERSVEGALTPRRMLSNIVHSFGRTERRIPSNPETAYHRYCSN
jgi:arabinofuranosyltransferase